MLKNFYKAALRHLRRDKPCSAINIISLSGAAALPITLLTVSVQTVRAAMRSPSNSLCRE